MGSARTRFIVQFAVLAALEALVCFTPLGSIPLGPLVATLSHIPVIIAAIMLGTGAGAAMGFLFGLFSFIVWSTSLVGSPIAFVFTPIAQNGSFLSLLICFVPRILIGVVTGVTCRSMSKVKSDVVRYGVSGLLGSLTNTLLVLSGIYLLFGQPYAAASGIAFNALLGVMGISVLTNGLPEAFVGVVAATGICIPLKKALGEMQG